ncbi:conserved hypothetical protein [Uncinocarpus reesii 1704]|uniref:Thioredoxin n=1 Tax=Uncinocarpus reesii (strain UAMH 1704) TaxID=336963 RepID=C4JG62_UNCRE|nr:uncharacterized protein UREG_02460 [Uncinocarpus reesii 1704]EEP77611.1 conserved hypothetical protein [Uncinocarpus reesii 1704]
MAKPVSIASSEQFFQLLTSSKILVADFYADWCGPCKTIAPVYEQLSARFSRPNEVTFTKVNVDQQQEISGAFSVTAMPTFLIFKDGDLVKTIKGANAQGLTSAVAEFATASEGGNAAADSESSETGAMWLGAATPKSYQDITENVEVKDIDLLNCDNDIAPGRVLFGKSQPSALRPKAKEEGKPDWVESDADEQLMLFMPFQASLKIHSLHITSLPPKDGDDEVPMRPKTIKFYTNRSHIIGFDEADDIQPTQEITIAPEDWDAKTGTAVVELRFVKFQRVSSVVAYFVDGDGDGDKIRLDRLRLFGESGEKREMGKLEKFGEAGGE